MDKMYLIISIILLLLLLVRYAAGRKMSAAGGSARTQIKNISQDEARRIMKQRDDCVIVDVRTANEYAAGHIPGAILIPNESIRGIEPKELPDKGQMILVYCYSGNRSRQASRKLANMGYSNVHNFGGMIRWTGDIVRGK